MSKSTKVLITTGLLLLNTLTAIAATPTFGIDLLEINENGVDVGKGRSLSKKLTVFNMDGENYITVKLSLRKNSDNEKENIQSEWIEFATEEVILSPKEKKEVEYVISIPEQIDLGTYRGSMEALMTNYSNQPPEKIAAAGVAAEVKVLFASAANLKVNVTESTGGTVTEKVKDETASNGAKNLSPTNFLEENWLPIVVGLAVLVAIGIIIKKKKLS